MGKNTIKQIETKVLPSDNGSIHAIFIALDIYDKNNSDNFIAEVLEKFTLQKMISPPDTTFLLITIIGHLSAEEFCTSWKSLIDKDVIAKTILSMLNKAAVVHGTNEGKIIDEKSLIS
jgi:hypothetical protein